jgi:hypothetical protein
MGNRSRMRPGRGQFAGGGRPHEQQAGSLEDSPSLRHMAANGLTPDGQLERLSIEAEMATTPGWRGTVLRVCLILALAAAVAGLASMLAGTFR